SEKALGALKKLVPYKCYCLRSGILQFLYARDLVPGDIVHLNVGCRVPADLRVFESTDLRIDEASFTGETDPVLKSATQLHESNVSTGGSVVGMKNCAFTGTLVRCGTGKGIVICTGEESAFGDIFRAMQEEEAPKTPLQRNMDRLGKQLSFYSLCIIVGIVIIGLLQRRQMLEMFQIGVSLAVAAIPEGLPIVVTVTLAIGVMRMAKRNAIVKKLPVVETLGCVNVVCSDKTGTLTQNEMTVTRLITSDGLAATVSGVGYAAAGDVVAEANGARLAAGSTVALRWLCLTASCCNNAEIRGNELHGQPTEGALVALVNKLNGDRLKQDYSRIQEWPFNSDTKLMTVKCERKSSAVDNSADLPTSVFFVKGAPDRLVRACTSYWNERGQLESMTSGQEARINDWAAQLGVGGLRVLGLACGPDQQNLTFCGLVGLLDPPRPGVKDSIRILQQSGVLVTMVTGDAMETACTIARQLGISGGTGQPISGEQLDQMQPDDPRIPETRIFYRTSPRHKNKIVRAFQAVGKVVAMTGDGVNDAVALKAADIGIAMGMMGTEVSKEAADMILIDDHFQTILAAVEEGKAIFHNIRCFIRFSIDSTSIAALTTAGHHGNGVQFAEPTLCDANPAVGKVVAMTGDGVNDAVALKAADIGIAMGMMGTEVSKEAADMILIDDHFQTILAAVEEGKAIFHNIRCFIRFQLSTSIAALTLVTMATVFNLPSPLNAMQILWINILMDGPPAQSLGVEPLDPDLRKKPPRRPSDSVLPMELLLGVLRSALIIVAGTLFVFHREMSDNKVTPRDTTMTFTCFVLFDMFNALSCRSKSKSIFTIGLFSNRTFCIAVGLSLIGQLLVIYVPPFQAIFQTEALYATDLLFLVCLCSTVFWISELAKLMHRHHYNFSRAALSLIGFNNRRSTKFSDSIV
uniref:P-type Ca(2+) transporter n=1 Tax=Macrostomum lignano TaxID=282301 RepID=A0A1I8HDG5_9PLAT